MLSSQRGGVGWYLDQYKWSVEPNPNLEQIILSAWESENAMIDQIVVDTICIPEPATMILLAIGGLALVRRRSG